MADEHMRQARELLRAAEERGWPTEHERVLAALLAERDALKQTLHDELDGNLRLRDIGGARPEEPMTTFLERVFAERDALADKLKAAEESDAESLRLYRSARARADALAARVEVLTDLAREAARVIRAINVEEFGAAPDALPITQRIDAALAPAAQPAEAREPITKAWVARMARVEADAGYPDQTVGPAEAREAVDEPLDPTERKGE